MASKAIKTLMPIFILLFTANVIFANGGDQRVVENKYLINLSRAPFTPRVGIKISFLASFVDIQRNKLIREDLIVRVRISKLGEAPKGNFIFAQNNVPAKGGILDFPYTFTNAGLHEIFFDFAFASSPETTYAAPDFLIDVQKQEKPASIQNSWLIGTVAGIMGIMIGFLFGKIKIRKIKAKYENNGQS